MAGLFSSCSGREAPEPEQEELHSLEPIAMEAETPERETASTSEAAEPSPPVDPNFIVKSTYSGEDGIWLSGLTLRSKSGGSLSQGLINYDLRDCKSEQIFFNGDFLVGAKIGQDDPTQIRKYSQEWFSQVKPFLLPGSELSDGKKIRFDKKAWAIKNQKFFKMAEHQDIEPIELCQTLSLMDTEDNIQAQSTSKMTVLSRYIFDNNTYAKESVKTFPHQAGQFARSGGIEYIENSKFMHATNPKTKCITRNDKMFYVSGRESRFNVLSGVRYGLDEAYVPLDSRGQSLNDAIRTGTGLKFKHHARLTLGKDCLDHYGSVSVQVGFTDKEISGLEFRNGGRKPANTIRMRLAPFERF